jgi:hypothetical protein
MDKSGYSRTSVPIVNRGSSICIVSRRIGVSGKLLLEYYVGIRKELPMFGIGAFLGILVIFGMVLKFLVGLIILPLRIGFGLVKLLLILLGIPLLILLLAFGVAIFPILLIIALMALILMPLIIFVKVVS